MSDPMVFVQARMASTRFPGKALAPLWGLPLIATVMMMAEKAVPRERVVLCTTTHLVDDPLSLFVERLGFKVYRGPAENVVLRFQQALTEYPCERFFRVCGDSPLLDPGLFAWFLVVEGNSDLVTNVFPRTFPNGQSLELIRSGPFSLINSSSLTAEQREHPTRFYYDHPDEFSIVNVRSDKEIPLPDMSPGSVIYIDDDMSVDTIEDLHRIEAML